MLPVKTHEILADTIESSYSKTSTLVIAAAQSGSPLGLGIADLPPAYGRHVVSVVEGEGRADTCGFIKGDILISVAGEAVAELTHKKLMLLLATAGGSGDSFDVEVGRSGNPTHATTVTLKIGTRKKGTPLGIGVADTSSIDGIGNHKITILKKSSTLRTAGCKEKDFIITISGINVEDTAHEDVMKILATIGHSGTSFELTVGRGGASSESAANVVTPGRNRPKLGNYAMPATPLNMFSPAPGDSPGMWNESPKGFTPKPINNGGYLTVASSGTGNAKPTALAF